MMQFQTGLTMFIYIDFFLKKDLLIDLNIDVGNNK